MPHLIVSVAGLNNISCLLLLDRYRCVLSANASIFRKKVHSAPPCIYIP